MIFIEEGYYPVFLLPDNLKEYIESGYQFEKPEKPRLNMDKPEPQDESNSTIGFLFAIILILAFMLIFGAIPSMVTSQGDMAGAVVPLFIIVVILILILKSLIDKDSRSSVEYFKKLELYQQKQSTYEKKMEIYNMQVESYNSHLSLLADLNNSNDTMERNTRLDLLSDFYYKNTASPIKSIYPYKKGYSEDILYSALKECFGEKIFKNLTVDNELYSIKRPYMPDIVYYSEDSGFIIDIEIDEKYIKESLEPIHCLDDSYDKRRNDFFTSNGWFVLRFSEDQVLSDIKGCLSVFYKILKKYDNVSQPNINIKRMMFFAPVRREKRWTKEDVINKLMA